MGAFTEISLEQRPREAVDIWVCGAGTFLVERTASGKTPL